VAEVLPAEQGAERAGPSQEKIFVIGLSRTGTSSLTAALKLLGYRACHYPHDPVTQRELMEGQYNLSVLKDLNALTDIPVAPFYPQLDRIFPGSKFILSTRETGSWLASMENHFRFYVEYNRDPFSDFMHACVYGALHFNADRFAYAKEVHEHNVRRYFAGREKDFLVLDVTQGDPWDQLCRFLDRPRPQEPFPRMNKRLESPAIVGSSPLQHIQKRILKRMRHQFELLRRRR
jgi:Sulfotransferase domain